MYQYFKRQLKTPTCFGSFVIHHQGVLNMLDWNYLWYFCVRSRCLAAWFFGPVLWKRNVKFVRYISKIANLGNNWWSGSGLTLWCVCVWCDEWELLLGEVACLLISEQQATDTNPLFDLATVPRYLQATSPDSSSQLVAPGTHTTG